MELFDYLMAKKGHNTSARGDLFSYLLGKKASGGSGTYTTFSGTSLNISNTIKAAIKKFMLNSTELTQDGTPTPDNPVDVNVITGSNNVKMQNKNFFNKNNIVYINNKILNDSGVEISDSTGGYTKMYIQIKANTEYTISGLSNIGGKRIYYFDENKMFISRSTSYSQISTITFTTPSNAKYIDIQYYINGNDFNNWQIEQGSSATEYIEHQEQNYPITLSSKNLLDFNKITVGKLGTYGTASVEGNNIKFTATGQQVYGVQINLSGLNLKNNTTYTIANLFSITTSQNPNGWRYYDGSSYTVLNNYREYFTFTTTESGVNQLLYYIGSPATFDGTLTIYNIQLLEGTILQADVPNYAPYIANPLEYCKIGDYADQIFKNTTDNEFYDSTLLENEWYLKKNIEKMEFNNNNVSYAGTWLGYNNVTPILIKKDTNDVSYGNNLDHPILCTKAYHSPTISDSTDYLGAISVKSQADYYYLIMEYGTTLSQARTALNGGFLYHQLITPTYIHISETDYPILRSQLENLYNNAESYNGQTNITQTNDDLPFNISVNVKVLDTNLNMSNSLNSSLLSNNLQNEEETSLGNTNEIDEIEEPIEEYEEL